MTFIFASFASGGSVDIEEGKRLWHDEMEVGVGVLFEPGGGERLCVCVCVCSASHGPRFTGDLPFVWVMIHPPSKVV